MTTATASSDSRHCPQCDEIIKSNAYICRYCHSAVRSSNDSEVLSQWLRAHPTLTLSLATFLYVAFRVYKAADFEVNTMLQILRANGLTPILLGVLLVQLPAELLLLTAAGCWWLYSAASDATPSVMAAEKPVKFLAGSRVPPLLLLATLIALAYTIIPWVFFLALVLVLSITVTASYRAFKKPMAGSTKPCSTSLFRRAAGVITLRRFILAIGIVVLLYAINGPAIWVDAENLTTTDHGNIVGYVINDSDPWTTILIPTWTGFLRHGNSILMEKTANITGREPCTISISQPSVLGVKMYRPIQLWRAWTTRRPVPLPLTPRCPFPSDRAP